jgi:phosphate transport system protein
VRGCTNLPYEVIKQEAEVDDLTEQVFNELLVFMMRDPKTVTRATRISYISKYLERIADHATNIAEMVLYLCQGKMVRHSQNIEGS